MVQEKLYESEFQHWKNKYLKPHASNDIFYHLIDLAGIAINIQNKGTNLFKKYYLKEHCQKLIFKQMNHQNVE